jgi:hypothetical protein
VLLPTLLEMLQPLVVPPRARLTPTPLPVLLATVLPTHTPSLLSTRAPVRLSVSM